VSRRIFALTTRGLEAVSADEIAALPGVTVERTGYRRVVAACAAPLASLLRLRTVDDVFLDVAEWPGIGRPRSSLDVLGASSGRLNLHEVAAVCTEIRPIRRPPTFSVTANFVGKRNYSTQEIKKVCAQGIVTSHGWTYTHNDATADLNVRIFIEHDTAFVGVRLAKRPLYKRPYKQSHVPGSLKPPVAAALLALVGMTPGMRVLDPCCGAGTILIEAALGEAEVEGGDNDAAAIAAAQANAAAAGVAIRLQLWDAQALPVADASMDRIVSNLPWGRKVSTDAALKSLYHHICAEMHRVLAPGGQIVLLTNAPQLVNLKFVRQQIEISLFGQTPTIMIASGNDHCHTRPCTRV
jgi:tRNA (guanine6-N2)-methyltransferase